LRSSRKKKKRHKQGLPIKGEILFHIDGGRGERKKGGARAAYKKKEKTAHRPHEQGAHVSGACRRKGGLFIFPGEKKKD